MVRWAPSLAVLVCVSCGSDAASTPDGGAGAGASGSADASEAAAVVGCPASGVSKGPWALHFDETSAVVRWEACREGTPSGITVTPETGGSALEFDATVSPFDVTNTYTAPLNPDAAPDSAGTYYMHEARLTGLDADSCYRYALAADVTAIGRVCTAHGSGVPFTFVAVGDTNPGLGQNAQALFQQIDGEPYEFVVHGGDIQYYASFLETWAYWFGAMAPMLRHGAFQPAVGNHESEQPDEFEQYYLRLFGRSGFDGTDEYYRFESGGVWFFSLDTEQDTGAGSEQALWLEQWLADASTRPGYRFSVVYFHRPMLTCGDTGDNTASQAALQPLFERYRVPLVIQAHMHGYERFEIPIGDAGSTITYLTAGGGGGLLGNVDANIQRAYCSERAASGAFFNVAALSVDATKLSGRVIDRDGAVRDSFEKLL